MENDLISRKSLMEKIDHWANQVKGGIHHTDRIVWDVLEGVTDAICDEEAVEAEPVRHGRWGEQHIIGYDGIHPVWGRPCSGCGYETELYYPNYCPNCGCKMDAKEDGHG